MIIIWLIQVSKKPEEARRLNAQCDYQPCDALTFYGNISKKTFDMFKEKFIENGYYVKRIHQPNKYNCDMQLYKNEKYYTIQILDDLIQNTSVIGDETYIPIHIFYDGITYRVFDSEENECPEFLK